MFYRLFTLCRAKQTTGTAQNGLTLGTHHIGTALWALRWHIKTLCIVRALRQHHARHFGYHITGAINHHRVIHPNIHALDFVLIVQSGIGDRNTSHFHGTQSSHRRQCARTPHLYINTQQCGNGLLSGKLMGNRPARRTRHKTQYLLLSQLIDFVNHAVNIIGQLTALLRNALVKRQASSNTLHRF